MRLIIQRVVEASVTVDNQMVSKIGRGILVLMGIHRDDDLEIAKKLAHKLPKIRLWDSEDGKSWSHGAQDNGYEILIVSQFTLYNTMKGNKPDFHLSMKADQARLIYQYFVEEVGKVYSQEKVKGGVFQEMMMVSLVNDGPVTIEVEETPKKQDNIKIQSAQQLDQNQLQ